MKFIVSALIIIHCSFYICIGQSAVLQSAADAFKHKEYAKGKEYIDQAAAYDKTSNDPKMWYYRGQIYLAIYRDTTELGKSNPDAAEKSAISFMNCIKTDKGKYYENDCNNLIWVAGVALYKKAGEALRDGDLERAARSYDFILDVIPYDKDNNMKRSNVTTETVNKNLYYVAFKAKDTEKSKQYLQKLIDVKHNDPMIYIYMSRIYLQAKDTAKAVSYIEQGRSLFEDNSNLINEQINLYIAQGRTTELIDKLTATIEGGQESEVLYYVRGTLYQDTTIKQYDKAAEDFKKAIELKPDYLDVYYRLGAMYFNEALEMGKLINNIKETDEFNKAKAKVDQKFKDAQPYLEKAFEINLKKTEDDITTYKNTVKALGQLYARTNQMDKYNQLKELTEKK